MSGTTPVTVGMAREQRLKHALFRGAGLTLENPDYVRSLRTFMDELLRTDLQPRDLTVAALEGCGSHTDAVPEGDSDEESARSVKSHEKQIPRSARDDKKGFSFGNASATAVVLAREAGVAAGLEELAFLLRNFEIDVQFEKRDGDSIAPRDTLVRLSGDRMKLLSLERVGLNLLQRMSGIATATHNLQERVRKHSSNTWIVGTRKTPWGLLDKRALHLGGGGTHRIGLGDAILIKNNHLALIASREEDAAPQAITAAWRLRSESVFIEVEVRGLTAAVAAARAFDRLLQKEPTPYPCLLMLDNLAPREITQAIDTLRGEGLLEAVLIEASGGITNANLDDYASTGVDAISIGALTHSARALDISQSIS